MRKSKYYRCEICGEEVFKEYWQGQVVVREVKSRKPEGTLTGMHTCSLNTRRKS